MKSISYIAALLITVTSSAFAAEKVKPALPVDPEHDEKLIENPDAAKTMMTAPDKGGYKKDKWDSMTRAEKLKMIEQRHAERSKKYEAKWKSMSDDEKIAQYEKRRKRFMEMREKRRNMGANKPAAAQ